MIIKSSKMTLIYCRSGNGSGIWSSIRLSVRLCTSPGPDDLSIQHIDSMHSQVLDSVDSAQYLGVDITSDLSFTQHINRTTANASKILGYLKRNILTKNPAVREAAYKTIVFPQVEYASTVWSSHIKKI